MNTYLTSIVGHQYCEDVLAVSMKQAAELAVIEYTQRYFQNAKILDHRYEVEIEEERFSVHIYHKLITDVKLTEDIDCPFCSEPGLDLIGLKIHLARYCDQYDKLTVPKRIISNAT